MGGRWKAYRTGINGQARIVRTAKGKTYEKYVDQAGGGAFTSNASKAMRQGTGWTTARVTTGQNLKNVYVGRGNRLLTYNGLSNRGK